MHGREDGAALCSHHRARAVVSLVAHDPPAQGLAVDAIGDPAFAQPVLRLQHMANVGHRHAAGLRLRQNAHFAFAAEQRHPGFARLGRPACACACACASTNAVACAVPAPGGRRQLQDQPQALSTDQRIE